MKALIIIISISLSSIFTLQSQVYVKLNGGYGLGVFTEEASSQTAYYDYYGKPTVQSETVDYSFGQKFNFGGSIGYQFNKNMGAEISCSYILGDTINTVNEYHNYQAETTIHQIIENESQGRMLRIIPSFVFYSGLEKINPYVKVGMIVGIGSITQENLNFNNNVVTRSVYEYNGGIHFGINAGIGVLYNINNKFSAFAEANLAYLPYSPSKRELVEYSINGFDKLADLSISEKQVEYSDVYNFSEAQSASQPSKQLEEVFPFSSVEASIGIRINFMEFFGSGEASFE